MSAKCHEHFMVSLKRLSYNYCTSRYDDFCCPLHR